ncbi:hypothetical protein L2E82_16075 [Cichorium intybus]|uniref:Uncharacterized protein n=1 Tax=Cichorium intybus TaxID=13427 RepID=A0ACB9F4I3_CICIN|nr:hypothetical protein L2E82_16075 [Cichorium intybus]
MPGASSLTIPFQNVNILNHTCGNGSSMKRVSPVIKAELNRLTRLIEANLSSYKLQMVNTYRSKEFSSTYLANRYLPSPKTIRQSRYPIYNDIDPIEVLVSLPLIS